MFLSDVCLSLFSPSGSLKFLLLVPQVKNCSVHINDDSVFEPEEEFQVHLGTPLGDHWSGAMVGANDIVTITITNDEDGESRRADPLSSFVS